MQRTVRQLTIDRAIVRALLMCGDYLLPEYSLRENVDIVVTPSPTRSEFEESLQYLDGKSFLVDGETLTGKAWKINDNGKAYAREHRIG